jgi:predicted secreted protein
MAYINGTQMLVKVDNVVVAGCKNVTVNVNVDLPDASTKDSAGWEENIHGRRNWSVDFDGLYNPAATLSANELIDLITTRDEVTLVILLATSGSYLTGLAQLQKFSMAGPAESPITISGTFKGNGAFVKTETAGS